MFVNVTNVEQSAQWYQRVLGMRRVDYGQGADHSRTAMLFGEQRVNLRSVAVSTQEWFTADHDAAGRDDLCFLSPLAFQRQMRLLEARQLLSTGGRSVSSVAFSVGYISPSQFSREYKGMFGTSPVADLTSPEAKTAVRR
ncbi:helix-turn-helix domain-containing protein [Rhizobium sp. CG4]|uniref:helix-turn-helix domain-containing protein n=1 Tax=Rhizobium sp. CG4 TaxID=2726075 RepID=UPI0033238DCF